MSPLKQPDRLTKIATKQAAQFIISKCVDIEQKCVNYDNASCKEQIVAFQDYLLQEVVHTLQVDVQKEVMLICRAKSTSDVLQDKRIAIDLLLHGSTKKFEYEWVAGYYDHDFDGLSDNIPFWLIQFGKLVNIVELNIDAIRGCTNEMLETIGLNCPNIEVLKVNSGCRNVIPGTGLINLAEKCKKLRILTRMHRELIEMDYSEHQTWIKSFLRSLSTVLEYCNLFDISKILVDGIEGVDTLALKRIDLNDRSSLSELQAVIRYCPLLKHLCIEPSEGTESDMFKILANSRIQLSTLHVEWFGDFVLFNDMNEFFLNKGIFLRSLILRYSYVDLNNFTIKEIAMIGENCPNIESLELDNYWVDESDLLTNTNANLQYGTMFGKLVTLKLGGIDFHSVLFLLAHATSVRSLALHRGIEFNGDMLQRMLSVETMLGIKSLTLQFETIKITIEEVCLIIEHCKDLKALTFRGFIDEKVRQHMSELNTMMKTENLDLKFVSMLN